nr:MAG TPA: hypothetical protein [Caudoviricetes sp.]
MVFILRYRVEEQFSSKANVIFLTYFTLILIPIVFRLFTSLYF